jgi:hypothetical protein
VKKKVTFLKKATILCLYVVEKINNRTEVINKKKAPLLSLTQWNIDARRQRGKRKEERGKRKEERGKRKEERVKRKEERPKTKDPKATSQKTAIKKPSLRIKSGFFINIEQITLHKSGLNKN